VARRKPLKTLSKLAQLQRVVESLPYILGDELRKTTQTKLPYLIDKQFATGTNIYNRKWLLPKDGHRPPMIRTGRLRRGFMYRILRVTRGWELRITNKMYYSSFLQFGTYRMQPRVHLPKQGKLPIAFRRVLNEAQRVALIKWRKAAEKVLG
jgi:hypothetical protein